ncbi:MAG: SGNH/GDSL hydrolase family protein [Magnetococcales bacterium]|nr:SGNH/GDSL hydrolase family protein [Magnetococcales bacterium]
MKITNALENKRYRLRTDEDGYIIGDNDLLDSVKSQKVEIIFLGGSTTECLHVDEGERFPYLISTKIKYTNGQPIRILNGGVAGNNVMHSVIKFLAKGVKYKPKRVVMMHAINDLVLFFKTLSYWTAPNSRSLVSQKARNDFYELGESIKNLLIPNIPINVLSGLSQTGMSDEWVGYRHFTPTFNEVKSTLYNQFKPALKVFVETSKSFGSEPILMTQFNRLTENDKLTRSLYEKDMKFPYEQFVILYRLANSIVRDVARENDIFLIDLDRQVEKTAEYMYDSVHLNTQGSRLVSDIISTSLLYRYPLDYTHGTTAVSKNQ